MYNYYFKLFKPFFKNSGSCNLLLYRVLFTFLPLSVTILSRKLFSQSEFSDFNVFLVYLISYSGFLSIGFYATFQYLSARNRISPLVFYYLLSYLLFLLVIYLFLFFLGFIFFENWLIGVIILFYFGNESLLNIYIGQRDYNYYYLFSGFRYLFFLCIVLSGKFSGTYPFLLIFEFLLFIFLFFNFFRRFRFVQYSPDLSSVFLSNIIPTITSSFGPKNILFYSTFYLGIFEVAQIKYTYAFFGILNFIPNTYTSDKVNMLIKSQNFAIQLKSIKYLLFLFFLISIFFSYSLFFSSYLFSLISDLDLGIIILLAFYNYLLQISNSFNQFLFASGKSKLRSHSDILYATLMFLCLGNIFNNEASIFLLISIFAVFVALITNIYRYVKNPN